MKCLRCGQECDDSLKFCPNCGNSLASNEMNSSMKKGNGKGFVIFLVIAIIIAGLACGYFFFFKKESNKTSVERMDTALANLQKSGNESGTIKLKLELSAGYAIDFNAFVKYSKQNDKYYMQLGVEKSLIMDEINMYAVADNNTLTMYIPSSIMNMLGSTGIDNNSWFKYSYDYSNLGINLSDLEKSNTKVDSSKIFNENNLKYIEKKDGLYHYQITLDKDFVKAANKDNKYTEEQLKQITDMNVKIDVYIDSKDNLVKMVYDMSDYMKKQNLGTDKAIMTIEFVDLNKTTVTIPDEAIKSSTSLDSYLNNNTKGLHLGL